MRDIDSLATFINSAYLPVAIGVSIVTIALNELRGALRSWLIVAMVYSES